MDLMPRAAAATLDYEIRIVFLKPPSLTFHLKLKKKFAEKMID